MSGQGEIWLDTSILLPVLAETLLDDADRAFTLMLRAAREAGLKLNMIPGVVEEVLAHIGICSSYERSQAPWRGSVPFLSAVFAVNQPTGTTFASWIDRFIGSSQPTEDIAEYLNDFFGIEVISLGAEVSNADASIRAAVQEAWIKVHQNRRSSTRGDWDEHLTYRLAEHDTENYLGVLERRRLETGKSSYGHTIWWLTTDSAVPQIAKAVAQRLGNQRFDKPVLSPDFLVNYLALGPNRGRISKQTESWLPLIMDAAINEVPAELMMVVSEIRER